MEQEASNDVSKALIAALEHDPRIDLHRYPVQASLQQGKLLLQGAVENIAAKKLFLAVAFELAGDSIVLDRLRVSASNGEEDGTLRVGVVNALQREPALSEYSLRLMRDGKRETVHKAEDDAGLIDISVEDGVVSLSGHVGSLTHRRLAEVLVWWVAGCQAVNNQLEVVPPEEDNDGELTDAVRMAFEKDPLVHASQLLVSGHDGTVTLEGFVASKEEKKLAALDAWYVPGVLEVVDHIETRD